MHDCKSTLCTVTFSLATGHPNQITSAYITQLLYTRFFQTTGCCHPDFIKQVHLCKHRGKHSCLCTVLATCSLKFPAFSWGTPPSSMLPYLRVLEMDHSRSQSSGEKCLSCCKFITKKYHSSILWKPYASLTLQVQVPKHYK